MSFATCDRGATQAPGHLQLNPPGRSSLGEFPRRSRGQPRMLSGQALRSLVEIRPNSLRRLASRTGYTTLARERVNDSVYGSSGALHNAVRDVLRCNCSVFRDVFRPVDRSRLNAANANSEREND